MKCLDGTDAGVEVVFKTSTVGGIKALAEVVDLIRDRLGSGKDDIAPIVLLEQSSYPHSEHGRIWEPVFKVVGWMTIDGPAPAVPKPTTPPAPCSFAAGGGCGVGGVGLWPLFRCSAFRPAPGAAAQVSSSIAV
jgi:hypothetical protein